MAERHRTILLVEDDENDVVLMRRAFLKASLTNPVQIVRSGEEAIRYLRGEEPYSDRSKYALPVLLLLDLKLPGTTGFEVLSWVRSQARFRYLPVVVLTASDAERDMQRVAEMGANSYLVKPLGPARLLEMVQALNLYWCILNQAPTADLHASIMRQARVRVEFRHLYPQLEENAWYDVDAVLRWESGRTMHADLGRVASISAPEGPATVPAEHFEFRDRPPE